MMKSKKSKHTDNLVHLFGGLGDAAYGLKSSLDEAASKRARLIEIAKRQAPKSIFPEDSDDVHHLHRLRTGPRKNGLIAVSEVLSGFDDDEVLESMNNLLSELTEDK